MIAKLYRGDVVIGSIDLGRHRPYRIAVMLSLSGEVIRLGPGLDHATVPPNRVEHVFVRQLVADFDSRQTETRYVLAEEPEPFAEPKKFGVRQKP